MLKEDDNIIIAIKKIIGGEDYLKSILKNVGLN